MAERPTMAFRSVDRVLLAVHLDAPPTDDDWTRYCAETQRMRGEMRAGLIYSLGGGPNSKQREQVRQAFDGTHPPPMAVMTSSTVVRGIITSLNWFMSNRLAAFELNDFDGAFAYLEQGGEKLPRGRLRGELHGMLAQLQASEQRAR